MWWPLLNWPSFHRKKLDFGKAGTTSAHTRTHMHACPHCCPHTDKCIHVFLSQEGARNINRRLKWLPSILPILNVLPAWSLGIAVQINEGLDDFCLLLFCPHKTNWRMKNLVVIFYVNLFYANSTFYYGKFETDTKTEQSNESKCTPQFSFNKYQHLATENLLKNKSPHTISSHI